MCVRALPLQRALGWPIKGAGWSGQLQRHDDEDDEDGEDEDEEDVTENFSSSNLYKCAFRPAAYHDSSWSVTSGGQIEQRWFVML